MARPRRRLPHVGRLTCIHRDGGAWSVRMVRAGQPFADYFPDAVWGGRALALVAAQRFRDRLLLRVEPDTRVRRRVAKGSTSATGVPGVNREPYVVGGRHYERFVACWPDPEKGSRKRRFSIRRYGKELALALAIETREAGVARSRARLLALQREEAERRLLDAPPMPRQVKDPLDRKGISMAGRRPRRVK